MRSLHSSIASSQLLAPRHNVYATAGAAYFNPPVGHWCDSGVFPRQYLHKLHSPCRGAVACPFHPILENMRNLAASAPLRRVWRAVVDVGAYSVASLTAALPEATTRRYSRPTTFVSTPATARPAAHKTARLCFAHGECNPPRCRVDGSASSYGGGHADFYHSVISEIFIYR